MPQKRHREFNYGLSCGSVLVPLIATFLLMIWFLLIAGPTTEPENRIEAPAPGGKWACNRAVGCFFSLHINQWNLFGCLGSSNTFEFTIIAWPAPKQDFHVTLRTHTVIIAIAKIKILKCHLRLTLTMILGTTYSLVRPLLMLVLLMLICSVQFRPDIRIADSVRNSIVPCQTDPVRSLEF